MRLKFGDSILGPEARKLADMRDVVHDRKWLETAENVPVYYMYRDLGLDEVDRERIKHADLRYDITVIPAGNLGIEFTKTMGHYHPKAEGANVSYPELYQIMGGEAHFLLQKLQNDVVADAFLVRAKKLDCVLIPPDYGHVTINPGKNDLKMANWVCRTFSSIYKPILEKKGACYFELNNGEFVENRNYGKLPKLKIVDAEDLKFHLDEDMYNLVNNLKRLEFLKKPQLYDEVFDLK